MAWEVAVVGVVREMGAAEAVVVEMGAGTGVVVVVAMGHTCRRSMVEEAEAVTENNPYGTLHCWRPPSRKLNCRQLGKTALDRK